MKIWVKVCGITGVQDAEMVADAGAQAIGLNFSPTSPRCIDVQQAQRIVAAVRGRVAVVLVTVDMPVAAAQHLRTQLQPDWLQLHGREPDAWLQALQPQAFRAVGLQTVADVAYAQQVVGDWVLVDARDGARFGGTGKTAPWDLAAQVSQSRRTLLAGGLHPGNVVAAVNAVKPAGVDAASGLELAPGRKDAHKVRDFIQALREDDGDDV